jgi:hypothetical protein
MKKIVIIALIAALAFSAFACSTPEEPAQSESASSGGVGGSAEIASSEPSESADTGNISPTTGLPGNGEYRPVQVQIDNESTGRPQYGIQAADVVYEAMIEGADTRLSAIYNDTLPEKVGPVRSSRVYFQMIQNEWNSIYVHDGGPYNASFPKSYIYSDENGGDMLNRVDGAKVSDENIFWHVTPSIAYANVQAVEDKYAYDQPERDPLFTFDANVDLSAYPDVEKVDIPFLSKDITHVEYRYDSANDKFVRYFYGDPFKDAETDEAVTVQNVIVQYAEQNDLPGEGTATQATRIEIDMVGSGDAEFFVGGKHMTGTWEKDSRKDGTVYKLDDGSELVLKPGNTWIAIQPNSKNAVTTYADGTTYPADGEAS